MQQYHPHSCLLAGRDGWMTGLSTRRCKLALTSLQLQFATGAAVAWGSPKQQQQQACAHRPGGRSELEGNLTLRAHLLKEQPTPATCALMPLPRSLHGMPCLDEVPTPTRTRARLQQSPPHTYAPHACTRAGHPPQQGQPCLSGAAAAAAAAAVHTPRTRVLMSRHILPADRCWLQIFGSPGSSTGTSAVQSPSSWRPQATMSC